MELLAILIVAPLAVVLAFGSLIPFAKRAYIFQDLRAHWVGYTIYPLLIAVLVLEAGLLIQVMVLGLALGALIDRNIAYAPDGVVVPLLIISCMLSPVLGGFEWWAKLLFAAAFYGLADLAWTVQMRLGRQFITPADILSLLMPFLFFGLTLPYLLFNPLLAVTVILLQRIPALHRIISKPEAVEDAVNDTQMNDGVSALTLLTVSYPIFMLLIIWDQKWNPMLLS